jgi:hypothetical protein
MQELPKAAATIALTGLLSVAFFFDQCCLGKMSCESPGVMLRFLRWVLLFEVGGLRIWAEGMVSV